MGEGFTVDIKYAVKLHLSQLFSFVSFYHHEGAITSSSKSGPATTKCSLRLAQSLKTLGLFPIYIPLVPYD